MRTKPTITMLTGTFLTYSALSQLFSHHVWWFIQNVNLIFHEAGHIIFMLFGTTLAIFGGSLLEIAIPLLIGWHFARHRAFFSAAFCSWWLTTALLDVSIYASDAQERTLPLITGDVATHDWYNLLSMYHLLPYDDMIGGVFWLAALAATLSIVYFTLRARSDQQAVISKETAYGILIKK